MRRNPLQTKEMWVQSFTSLKADVRQDINGGFAFIWWLNISLNKGALVRLRYVSSEEKISICYFSHLG